MKLQYGLSSYKRGRGGLPELPVVNMVLEQAPTEEGGVTLLSRLGLSDRSEGMGTGPVQALFQRDNVLSSDLFGISGGKLYRRDTQIGSLDGTGAFSVAGYQNRLFATGGQSLWQYDGSTLSAVAFPDSAPVTKVLIAQSRLIALRADTGRYYYSTPLASEIDGLDFITAESQPDRLRDALFIDGVLILFGAETVEYHAATGSPDTPFQPIQGRVTEKGIRATGCATAIGSTFAWVTNQNTVCLATEDNVISNAGLQKRIGASATCRLFNFTMDGVDYLALRIDGETQVWKVDAASWSEFASYGQANWLAACHANGVFGSAIDGRTFAWNETYDDFFGQMERRIRAGFPIDGGALKVTNMRLRCEVGTTPNLANEPIVEMRLSDDVGQTWDEWDAVGLGQQGDYDELVEWRALGLHGYRDDIWLFQPVTVHVDQAVLLQQHASARLMFVLRDHDITIEAAADLSSGDYPAFLSEFRVTDPVSFRISGVSINEPRGGRA